MPLILLHEDHNTYGAATGKSHEAGFDSVSIVLLQYPKLQISQEIFYA